MAAVRLFEAAFQYLSGVSAVTALIGTGTACRIYELYAEQGRAILYPCVVAEDDGEGVEHQFGSAPTSETRLLALDCQATTAAAAQELANAVYAALIRQEAAIVTATGWPVRAIHCIERGTAEYFPDLETDKKLFSARLEFRVIQDIG